MKKILIVGLIFMLALFPYSLGMSQERPLISIDFRNTEIGDALRLLAKQFNLNIILSQDVTGPITVQFSNITIEEAIDAIVTTNGYAYTKWENVYRVTSPAAAEPSTRVFRLNNSTAKELKESFKKVLSSQGNIEVDERSNSIIVTDLPGVMTTIERLVKELDAATPQVLIEAKVIETVLDKTDNLGIDWTMKITAIGAKRPTTLPFKARDVAKDFGEVLPYSEPSTSTTVGDFPVTGTTPPLSGYPFSFPYAINTDFTLGTLNFSQFQAVLELLKSRSKTNLLSSPRITTLNNREAKVTVGTKIPIPIYERNETTGTFEITGYEEQEVGITLKATPNVSPEGNIKLSLHPEVSSIIGYTGPNNERPIVSTREADTQVQIKDGETVVIGGMIKEENIDTIKRVPILGYIPIIGFPFRKTEVSKEKTELLIFITAHILSDKKKEELTYQAMHSMENKEVFKTELEDYLATKKAIKPKRSLQGKTLKLKKR